MFLPSKTACHNSQFIRFLILLLLAGWMLPHPTANAQTPPPSIIPFQPVSGMLDDTTLREQWEFEGTSGQMISLVAARLAGDLDVVVELRNSENQLLAANDNADSSTTDARIEGLVLPNDDTYEVAVYREGLRTGITSGRFQLELLLGYSLYDISQTSAALAGRDEQTIASIRDEYFYLTSEVTMPLADTYLLQWRFVDTTGIQWIFVHDLAQDWVLSVETARNDPLRTTSGRSEMLPTGGATANVVFHRTERDFQVMVDGQVIARADVLSDLFPASVGSFSVAIGPNDTDLTLLNNIRLTTAYYQVDPSTVAIPPTPSGERIYNYNESPSQVVSTLRALNFLPPPTQTSGLQGDIVSGFITNDEASFNAYPLIERPFRNFVLSWSASFISGTPSAGCGVIFRQISGDTFATVLHTTAGGFYFFEVENGRIQSNTISTITPFLEQGLATSNTFTVVVANDTANLFINGRHFSDLTLRDASGLTLAHLVLDNNTPTYCQLERVWLWSLD